MKASGSLNGQICQGTILNFNLIGHETVTYGFVRLEDE